MHIIDHDHDTPERPLGREVVDAVPAHHQPTILEVAVLGPFEDGTRHVQLSGDTDLLTPGEARQIACWLIEAAARAEYPR